MAKPSKPSTDTEPGALFVFDFEPRVEVLDTDATDLYKGHRIKLVTNQPDAEVVGNPIAGILAAAIQEWTFKLKDGTVAPITPESIEALPPDLAGWLRDQWQERRTRPLAMRLADLPKPTTSSPNGHPTLAATA